MRYPCPCCGYLMFTEPPGSYDICEICFWEDDMFQLKFPNLDLGPNHISLIDAQKHYKKFGVSELRIKKYVRKVTKDDRRDPQWRQIDISKDTIAGNDEFLGVARHYDWEEDKMSLYYWRKK